VAAAVGGPPTIAIAFDAAEPALVRRLMAAGDMPVLAGLADRGHWATVTSSARISSASVWPTFATASPPQQHGHHYVWRWQPDRMRIVRDAGIGLSTWWRALAAEGRRVLTFDIPFIPFADVDGCTEIAEWGPHDRLKMSVRTRPRALAAEIRREFPEHPFQREPAPPHDRPSMDYLAAMAAGAADGARLRGRVAATLLRRHSPELAIVAFTELHRASHMLWQTVAPDDPLLLDRPHEGLDDRALIDIFAAADSAVGEIAAAAHPDARIHVFGLHGMRSCRGLPALLHPLLIALGYAAPLGAGQLAPGALGRQLLAAGKRGLPDWARQRWRSSMSPVVMNAVARPNAMQLYDWSHTRAFALPTDQHGWVRINLVGREAAGIVPDSHYRGLCEEIAASLLAARTPDGRPVVKSILTMADDFGGRPPAHMPDLIIDWDDAAHDDPVRIAGTDVCVRPEALRLTGKHAYDGFLLSTGVQDPGDEIASSALHEVIGG
jgi:predicted AlkP superfamily phosphohydrolase/phosphomutase